MFRKGRVAGLVLIVLILSVAAYAFAAANSVPSTAGGDGSGDIAGYNITNVTYQLDTNKQNITGVSFTAATTTTPAPTAPKFVAYINTTDSTCTGTTSVVCTLTTSVSLSSATTLRVVAYQ